MATRLRLLRAMVTLVVAVLAQGAAAGGLTPAAAQVPHTLSGVVHDTAGAPVPRAVLTVQVPGNPDSSTAGAARTDSLGRFRVAVSGTGTRVLRVRALGYAPQAFSFDVDSGALPPIELVLERVTALPLVAVRARSGDWRVRQALADIEYRTGRGLTRVADSVTLARWGGMRGALESIGVRHGPKGELRGLLGRPVCVISNGGLDGTAPPMGDIALMEYFASPSDGQPLELQMQCRMDERPRGLLIIWTKDFLEPGRRRRP